MVNFYLLGDMGTGENDQKKVSKALWNHMKNNKNRKNTFVCGLGDNIYEEGCCSDDDIQFIDKFEKPYSNIPNSIKFYMCLGNHDYGLDTISIGNSIYQLHYAKKSKENGKKWIMPSNYYSFKKGNTEFFVLDTNFYQYRLEPEKIVEQLNYISNLINNSKAKWKIVYGHHTWFSVGGHGGEDEEVKGFMSDLLKKCTFDVYMCGHDHNKQVIDLNMYNKKVTLIVCGTGGKVYHDYTNYDYLNNHCDPHFISNNLGFGFCNVHGNKLSFDFFDDKNKLEYSHLIKK